VVKLAFRLTRLIDRAELRRSRSGTNFKHFRLRVLHEFG
jgi:hypothetical protein